MTGLHATKPSARRKDLGDFPTPPGLVSQVLEAVGGRFDRVLEPTCGQGRFLEGIVSRRDPPREIRGFEIQADHAEAARALDPRGARLVVEQADLFRIDLGHEIPWVENGPLLVVGNLPWVTAAEVGASAGSNGPVRSNLRGLRGIDAMTGASNFDISEALWHKLIRELAPERPTIALLCKSVVARAVLRAVGREDLPVTRATLWRVNALRWFRASVDACLLSVEVGPGSKATEAAVYPHLQATVPESSLGFQGGRMVANLEAYRRSAFADGTCPLPWRQGIKHDAADVMELIHDESGQLGNKRGDLVDVEPEFVFPLLKGTDLAGSKRPRPRRSVIVTQDRLGADTRLLEARAPRLWSYLQAHRSVLERRKSSIYRGRPPFSIFGVGDYSFSPFKVAVSGLHKNAWFRVVEAVGGRPTMLDDTCYFLPCRTIDQAETLAEVLNGPEAQDLIRALVFLDAKRPITKALLQRIDLKAILSRSGRERLWRDEWTSAWTGRAFTTPST